MDQQTRAAEPPDMEALSSILGAKPEDLKRALPSLAVCVCPRGTPILLQGEKGREVYVVLKGRVSVRRSRWIFFQKEFARLGPGDLFGEIGFLVPTPRSATVVAEEDCEVFRIMAEDVKTLLKLKPELNAKLEEMARQRVYALAAGS